MVINKKISEINYTKLGLLLEINEWVVWSREVCITIGTTTISSKMVARRTYSIEHSPNNPVPFSPVKDEQNQTTDEEWSPLANMIEL